MIKDFKKVIRIYVRLFWLTIDILHLPYRRVNKILKKRKTEKYIRKKNDEIQLKIGNTVKIKDYRTGWVGFGFISGGYYNDFKEEVSFTCRTRVPIKKFMLKKIKSNKIETLDVMGFNENELLESRALLIETLSNGQR